MYEDLKITWHFYIKTNKTLVFGWIGLVKRKKEIIKKYVTFKVPVIFWTFDIDGVDGVKNNGPLGDGYVCQVRFQCLTRRDSTGVLFLSIHFLTWCDEGRQPTKVGNLSRSRPLYPFLSVWELCRVTIV